MWFKNLIVFITLVTTTLGIPFTLSVVESTPFDCSVRAWTRAPDLTPNLTSLGESRLVLNGTDCDQFVKLELGLKMNERSLVKLSKDEIDLPIKPEYNDTLEQEYYNHLETTRNNVFDIGSNRFYGGDKSPYQIARKEYETLLSSQSLWKVFGEERKVFDNKITLLEAEGDESLPLESVQSFILAVPDTIFPPSTWENDHFGGGWDEKESEYAKVESELTYYFSLTLRNGSVFEYLAGRTVFVPVATPDIESKQEVIKSIPMIRRNRECDYMSEDGKFTPSGWTKADNTTSFKVDVVLPDASYRFNQGEQIFLQTTIRTIGPVTEIPSYISFHLNTRTNLTHAGTFGRTLEEKTSLENKAEGSLNNEWEYPGISKSQIKTRKVKSRAEEEESMSKSEHSYQHYSGPDSRSAGGTVLNFTNATEQTVWVNLTIPHDALPSFKLTFKEFVSFLQVKLHTVSTNSTTIQCTSPRELTEDEKWSEYPRRSIFAGPAVKDDFIHKGNLSIHIDPAFSPNSSFTSASGLATSVLRHYTDDLATSPTLYSITDQSDLLRDFQAHTLFPVFPLVSNVIRTETEEEVVELTKYGRRSESRFTRRWNDDGSKSLSGQIWARKERRELDEKKVFGSEGVVGNGLVIQQ